MFIPVPFVLSSENKKKRKAKMFLKDTIHVTYDFCPSSEYGIFIHFLKALTKRSQTPAGSKVIRRLVFEL